MDTPWLSAAVMISDHYADGGASVSYSQPLVTPTGYGGHADLTEQKLQHGVKKQHFQVFNKLT